MHNHSRHHQRHGRLFIYLSPPLTSLYYTIPSASLFYSSSSWFIMSWTLSLELHIYVVVVFLCWFLHRVLLYYWFAGSPWVDTQTHPLSNSHSLCLSLLRCTRKTDMNDWIQRETLGCSPSLTHHHIVILVVIIHILSWNINSKNYE